MADARLAAIFGCSGPVLTAAERAFFAETRPWGFILFARNVETPDQVRELVAALRDSVDDPAAPVLIDQEGGRVQRLRPPHWEDLPPGGAIGALAEREGLAAGEEAARLSGRLLASQLLPLGITVDCVPLLDLRRPETHAVIGDRAFGSTPEQVTALARAQAEGLLAGGVLPVTKHIPGHGRATVDSHEALPRVEATLSELLETDFKTFKNLNSYPISMTAHVVFEAVDPTAPATTSPKVISEILRGEIGFQGLLLSDDLSMQALGGSLGERAAAARKAGCDIALHCNGRMEEMQEVAAAAGPLEGESAPRAEAALGRLRAPEPCDPRALKARLDALLDGAAGA